MIPLWKLKREITRIGLHLQAIPQAVIEPIRQARHDRKWDEIVRIEDGDAAETDKVALFLVYQPNGVAESVFHTCRHLIANGYAPLVVCNFTPGDHDRKRLREQSWKLAERPNFGYDFGGYRDGIKILQRLKKQPNTLLMLNDSVWFPITDDTDLIERMEQTRADYVGTQAFGRRGKATSRRKWAQPFFGSYCFMIKKPAFESDAFQDFWKNYKLSSNKESTLHRGERAFSYAMFDAGLESDALFSRERFDRVVADLNQETLELAIKTLVCTAPALIERHQQMLSADPAADGWRDAALRMIADAADSKNYIGSSPVIAIRELGFPMIKKNNERHYRIARERIKEAIDAGALPMLNSAVAEELAQRVRKQPTAPAQDKAVMKSEVT